MPSTYTSNNGLEKPGIGEQDGTWGSTLNGDIDLIDASLDGVSRITLTGTTLTLTITDGAESDARSRVLIFSGTPGSTVAVSIAPSNINKVYWIVNQSSQSISLSNGVGTTLTIPTITTSPAFCDGLGNVIGLQAGNNTFDSLVVTTTANLPSATNINGVLINTLINTLIGGCVSNFAQEAVAGGTYIIFTFGTVVGARFRLAFGFGTGTNGTLVSVPAGFPTSGQSFIVPSLNTVNAGANSVRFINITFSGMTIVTDATDSTGASIVPSASWIAVAWRDSY